MRNMNEAGGRSELLGCRDGKGAAGADCLAAFESDRRSASTTQPVTHPSPQSPTPSPVPAQRPCNLLASLLGTRDSRFGQYLRRIERTLPIALSNSVHTHRALGCMRCEQAPRCAIASSRMHFHALSLAVISLFASLLHTSQGFPPDHVIICAGELDSPCPSGLCFDSIDVKQSGITSGCADQNMCESPGCAFVENSFICCCEHSACNGKSEGFIKARLRMWNLRRDQSDMSFEQTSNETFEIFDHNRLSVRNAPALSSEAADSEEEEVPGEDFGVSTNAPQKSLESGKETSVTSNQDTDALITWGELHNEDYHQRPISESVENKTENSSTDSTEQQLLTTNNNDKVDVTSAPLQQSVEEEDADNDGNALEETHRNKEKDESVESAREKEKVLAENSQFSEERDEASFGNSTESDEEEDDEMHTTSAEVSGLPTDHPESFVDSAEEATSSVTILATFETVSSSLPPSSAEEETSTSRTKFVSTTTTLPHEISETTTQRSSLSEKVSTEAKPRRERIYETTKVRGEQVPQFGSERKPLVMEKGSIETISRPVDAGEQPPPMTIPWWLVALGGLLTAVVVCGVVYKLISRRSRGVTLPATGQEMTPLKRPNEEEGIHGNEA